MHALGAEVIEFSYKDKINSTYPRVCKVNINDRTIEFCFIKHTSKFISPLNWHQFIKNEYPEVIDKIIEL